MIRWEDGLEKMSEIGTNLKELKNNAYKDNHKLFSDLNSSLNNIIFSAESTGLGINTRINNIEHKIEFLY